MPNPGQGKDSLIRIGEQTLFDTAVAAHRKLEVITANVPLIVGDIADPSLYSGRSRRAFYLGGQWAEGSIVTRLNYENNLLLFKAAAGALTTTSVEANAVNDHVFKEGGTLPSLTCEMIEGNIPASKEQELVGMKVARLSIKGRAGQGNDGMLTSEFSVLARDKVDTQTPTGDPPTVSCVKNGTTTVTRASGSFITDGVVPGDTISGTGIPSGATVVQVTSATALIISAAATDSLTSTLTFAHNFPSPLPVLMRQMSYWNDGSADPIAVTGCSTVVGTTLTRASGNFTTDGVLVGDYVFCTGVPFGTTIVAVGTTTVTLSVAATAIASGLTATFTHSRIREIELTIDNQLSKDRFYGGAANPDEFLPDDFLEVTLRLKLEFQSLALFQRQRQFVTGSPKVIFQDPTTIGASSKREFEIRMNSGKLPRYENPVAGYGIILADATWRGFLDPTDASSFVMRFRNTETA